MLGGHLDMIAEYIVVADLELGDAGARAVVRFKFGDGAPAIAAGCTQIVERGVVALGDIPARTGVDRRCGDERA
jgi:hypothetical protein